MWHWPVGLGVPLLVLLIVVAAATGGSEDSGPPQADAPEVEQQEVSPTTTAKATQTPNPSCLPVAPAVLDLIASRLTVAGGGTLRNAQAVKSDEHQNVYYIAADIQGAGLEGGSDIGVWASNRIEALDIGVLIMTVDATAKEFSDWLDGGRSDSRLRSTDKGAERAVNCAKAVI